MSQLIRLLLRRETDLSEIVSALSAILWSALATGADLSIFDVVPAIGALPDPFLEAAVRLLFALGGAVQLLAVLRDMPRLRRQCALAAAATWSVVGLCRAVATGHYGPASVDIVLALAQSLAYVKMGKPPVREEA